MRLRAPQSDKSATPTFVGVALVFWALHACSMLFLAIAVRRCRDECHGFALAAVFSTSLLGSVVVICGGLAAWRWWHGDRVAGRSLGLSATSLLVGVALLVAAALTVSGVLENVVEGAPGSTEQYRSYRPRTGLTGFEVVAAVYAAAVGALAVAAAVWIRGRARHEPPR